MTHFEVNKKGELYGHYGAITRFFSSVAKTPKRGEGGEVTSQ